MLKRDRNNFLDGCARGDLPRAPETGAKLPLNFSCVLGFYLHAKPKLTKFKTGRVSLDWRSGKGNLYILQYCHIH